MHTSPETIEFIYEERNGNIATKIIELPVHTLKTVHSATRFSKEFFCPKSVSSVPSY
jgi:hypothetical protein